MFQIQVLMNQMKERPPEELWKRNNVEATIYQLRHTLRKDKTKYRRLFKQIVLILILPQLRMVHP